MDRAKQIRQLLIIGGASLFVLIGAWLAYDNLLFRLKSTTPASNEVATISPYVDFYFSQPIERVGEVSFSLNENKFPVDYTIEDRRVRVILPQNLAAELDYKLQLSNIQSGWFGNKITNETFAFTPIQQDFASLPADQRQELINQTNSGQINDPFLNNIFPITDGESLMIKATNGGDGKTVFIDITFYAEIRDADTGVATQLPNDKAEELRAKALELIKQKGGKRFDNYFITYSNDYLNQKYPIELDDHSDSEE